MIEMFIDGRVLVLPDDLSIRVEFNHPAFETDAIPASVVYYFDLPIRQNEETFNFANYTEVPGKYREYDWRMLYHGIYLLSGKLIVSNIHPAFKCAATLKQISTNFTDKLLPSFFQDIRKTEPDIQSFVDKVRTYGDQAIAFPEIYAPNLYGEKDSCVNPDWNKRSTPTVNSETVKNSIENRFSTIPLYKPEYLLNSIFQSEKHKIDTSHVAQVIKTLLIFNNYTLDSFPSEYFADIDISGLTVSVSYTKVQYHVIEDEMKCVNGNDYIIPQGGEYELAVLIKGIFLGDSNSEPDCICDLDMDKNGLHSPFLQNVIPYQLRDEVTVFNQTLFIRKNKGDTFGFSFSTFNSRGGLRYPRLFKITSGLIKIRRIQGSGETDGASDINGQMSPIDPKNHIPDVSAGDFLLSLKQLFGMNLFLDNMNSKGEFVLSKDMLDTQSLDLTGNVVEDSAEISVTEPTNYRLKYDQEEMNISGYNFWGEVGATFSLPEPRRPKLLAMIKNINSYFESILTDSVLKWQRVKDATLSVTANQYLKTESVDIKASVMPMDCPYGSTIFPYFDGPGISQMFSPEVSKTDKLIYLFLRSGSTASSTNINSWGIKNDDLISLSIDELYKQLLKPWYDYISEANEYTYDFKVTIEDMLNILELFKPQDKAVNEQIRRVRIGNQVYIPKQFTFELTHTRIKCQAKLMKNDGYK